MASLRTHWIVFWMGRAGLSRGGRLATRLATWAAPPYKGKRTLAQASRRGYISPRAQIVCRDLAAGRALLHR